MQRVTITFVCGWITVACAFAAQRDDLASWAKRDCDDSHAFVIQTSHSQNAHEVAAAMRENVRRQRETIKKLLQIVRSHPELRVAAELGLSEEGQQFWRDHRPSSAPRPAEVTATGQQLTACVNDVDAEAQKQMVSVLQKYNTDAEVLSASRALHQMWTENDQALLKLLLHQ